MQIFLKFAFALLAILLFISCGNKSSSDNKVGINLYLNSTGNFSMGDDYVLPPMPDRRENDSTLLGIDTNNNGVRDDVEHYIYNRFQGYKNSKVEREIAMQYARTAQLSHTKS